MLGIFGKKKATLFSGVSTGIATFLGFSAPSANGPTTTEEMLGVNAVFTAGRVIAEGVAQMPVRLIEELPGGRTRYQAAQLKERLLEADAEEKAAAVARAKAYDETRRILYGEPEERDGAVAPALRDAIGRLP